MRLLLSLAFGESGLSAHQGPGRVSRMGLRAAAVMAGSVVKVNLGAMQSFIEYHPNQLLQQTAHAKGGASSHKVKPA